MMNRSTLLCVIKRQARQQTSRPSAAASNVLFLSTLPAKSATSSKYAKKTSTSAPPSIAKAVPVSTASQGVATTTATTAAPRINYSDVLVSIDDLIDERPPPQSLNAARPSSSSSSSPSSSPHNGPAIGNGDPIGNDHLIVPIPELPIVSAADSVLSSSSSSGGQSPETGVNWTTSFHGMSSQPFSDRAADILMKPLTTEMIEIKPDGLIYVPEIRYRRILNQAFGPGAWGLVPRGEMTILKGIVSREWGMVVHGRLVSVARGEQQFFTPEGLPTATEGCKSNALVRCCKDLGIASECWDPSFIREFKATKCESKWAEHVVTKKKKMIWKKKGTKFEYPYTES